MKIIGLICARGNSQGIKNKNLLKFRKPHYLVILSNKHLSQNL